MIYPDLPKTVRIAIAIVVVSGSTFVIVHGVFHGRSGLSDFAGYYTAASIAARGDSVERMYDDAWFVGQINRLGLPDTTVIMYVNPPPVSLVMLPLVGFQAQAAKMIWNCINLLLAGGIILICVRMFQIPHNMGYIALFSGLILSTVPFLRTLQRGQLYVVTLFLVLLLLQGLRKKNAWLAGTALGILLVLKYFGWMFVLLFIASRRWKEVSAAIAGAIVVVALMILWFGTGLYEAHVQRLFAAFASSDLALTHLPAIPPFFGGFFVYHATYNPFPIADAPWAAKMLTVASVTGFLWATFRYFLKNPAGRLDRTFSALLVLSVVTTPLAAEHHYLMLIPAFWHLLFIGRRTLDGVTIASYALLGYLLFGWFPPIALPFNAWYSQLSAYPHLYGAILLWAGLIHTQPETERA